MFYFVNHHEEAYIMESRNLSRSYVIICQYKGQMSKYISLVFLCFRLHTWEMMTMNQNSPLLCPWRKVTHSFMLLGHCRTLCWWMSWTPCHPSWPARLLTWVCSFIYCFHLSLFISFIVCYSKGGISMTKPNFRK